MTNPFLSEEWQEMSRQFNDVMKQLENESEDYWNSLSKEEQLKVFCAVVRRIHQAELVDQGTYRHALYGVFGFGPESYAQAQMSGYLDIHNALYTEEELQEEIKSLENQ